MNGALSRLLVGSFVLAQLAGCMAIIDRVKITESNAIYIRSTGSPKFVSEKIRSKKAFAKLEANVGVVFDNFGQIRSLGIRKTSGNSEFDALMIEYLATWSFHPGKCPDKPCHIEIPFRFDFRD